MKDPLLLKKVKESDLDIFFENLQDPEAQHMAAFITSEPSDRMNFNNHWEKILNDEKVIIKSISFQNKIVGYIGKYESNGKPELTYWIGKKFWGKGITTKALRKFLKEITLRPIYARVARDNLASIRVLEKCGFKLKKLEKGYADARDKMIEEVVMHLKH